MNLLFWDIDGTLISVDGAGRDAWKDAVEERLGTSDRIDLAERAMRDARARHGAGLDAVYVIGDTPRDVECGLAIGARTIAVGTGPFSVEELSGCGAWWTVDQLPAPAEFFGRLGA